MKNIKLFLSVVSLTGLVLLDGCDLFKHDNVPQLPPITTEGKDTFGCLIDGKLFLPNAPAGQGTGVHAEIQSFPDTLTVDIYAGNYTTIQNFVIFFYDSPTPVIDKKYDLTHPKFSLLYINNSCYYDSIVSGSLNLLKFEVAGQSKTIAGTFEFTAYSKDCKTTVKVTEGRFDIGDVIL